MSEDHQSRDPRQSLTRVRSGCLPGLTSVTFLIAEVIAGLVSTAWRCWRVHLFPVQ